MLDPAPSTAAAIELALNATFPELTPLVVTQVLGSGFNSVAVETDAGLVFRAGRTPETAERYRREACLLPLIRSSLPVPVPEPAWLVERSASFAYGVSGHAKLHGRTLSPALLRPNTMPQLAAHVAEFMLALHRIPIDRIGGCSLYGPQDAPAYYEMLRHETSIALRERLSADDFSHVERWWDAFLADERITQFDPVLVHGDFWYENMLVDDSASELLGVVDWGDAGIADPVLDFMFYLGDEFLALVIEAYYDGGGTFEEAEMHRLRRQSELHEFTGVLHAMRFDEAEMPDAVRKLRSRLQFDGSPELC